MILMLTVISLCGFFSCHLGYFTCTTSVFPTISDVMADPPLNKLYSIILTVFSCTKQAEARAYHSRLKSLVSARVNNLLLFAALMSTISAPWIGFFDIHFNFPLHMVATLTFTLGEILYLFPLCYFLVRSRSTFPRHAQPLITFILYFAAFNLIFGLIMLYGFFFHGIALQIEEWVVFYSDFILRFVLSTIILKDDLKVY